ncbi:hypothetical protein [Mitsuaria sp. TWR114]|uniref:hypothetical protein n=1 Tax=Mitsuaria sp. TWR114 TaxID=2601731 RepID=UPI0011BE5498|nr:hypothetical protein [Mitsuaria sp. TWR114]
MRPMTQAETEQVNATLASTHRSTTAPPQRVGDDGEALIGSEQHEQMRKDFLRCHDEISEEDLDAFCAHLVSSFPDREITTQICPDDESAGILIFSVYGFSEREQLNHPEEDAFYDQFPLHLAHIAGPVTLFPRTGRHAARPLDEGARNLGGPADDRIQSQ